MERFAGNLVEDGHAIGDPLRPPGVWFGKGASARVSISHYSTLRRCLASIIWA